MGGLLCLKYGDFYELTAYQLALCYVFVWLPVIALTLSNVCMDVIVIGSLSNVHRKTQCDNN